MITDSVFQEGLQLLNQKEYQKAGEKFNTVLKENPRQAEAYIGLGLCLEKTGKLPDAIKMYKKAIENDPRNVTAIYNLGVVYLGLNQNLRAWYQFRKTLALQPNNSQALHNIGLIYFNQKMYKKAIRYLSLAADLPNEKAYAIYYLLAKAFQAQQKENEVLFYLYKSLQTRLDFLPALFELLKLYQKNGDWANFFEMVKKIYHLCPDNQALHGEILNSLQTIKEKNLQLNGIDGRKLDSLIAEFQTTLNPGSKQQRSRLRDLQPRVIMAEPEEGTPRVYH